MTDVNIRGFDACDASGIVKLHQKYNHWFEETELSVEYVMQCSVRHDFRFFVAECGGVIVGFSGVLFYESVGRAEVGPICISEAYRRKGVGSKLLEAVTSFLSQKSIHRLVARVKSENKLGVEFFVKNGFAREAVLQKYTKKGESVVQLVKFLPP
jgi:ribosomal protein S18 acetylase RimI-like enzyme